MFNSVQFICSVVSDSLQPHEWQHTRPPCPSPTPRVHPDSCASSQWCHPSVTHLTNVKNEGVKVLVTQSCLCDPMDCSPPGSSVHGIYQAGILEWVIISFSRGSSWPRDRTQVSHIADRFVSVWATREALLWRYFSIFTGLCNYQHDLNLKHFHHQRRKPDVPAHSSFPPLSPNNHGFTFSDIFAYSGYFISNGLIQYVVFCDWLFT